MSTTYLEPYIYLPHLQAWGTAQLNAPDPEPTIDYLAMLTPGSDDHSSRCAICESEGACRTWVEGMAEDANVPAQWIAEQVIAGTVNRYTTIAEINRLYLPF